jgi:hypothetical protein
MACFFGVAWGLNNFRKSSYFSSFQNNRFRGVSFLNHNGNAKCHVRWISIPAACHLYYDSILRNVLCYNLWDQCIVPYSTSKWLIQYDLATARCSNWEKMSTFLNNKPCKTINFVKYHILSSYFWAELLNLPFLKKKFYFKSACTPKLIFFRVNFPFKGRSETVVVVHLESLIDALVSLPAPSFFVSMSL